MRRRLIYHPNATRRPGRADDFVLQRGRIQLHGARVNPGQARALVYFGGNAENIDVWAKPLAEALPGHTIYLVAYRDYGASDGRPNQHNIVLDGLALHQHAAAAHDGGVDLIGRSLGSAIAVQVAAQADIRRLVLVTPFASALGLGLATGLPRWLARLVIPDHWDSATAAAAISCPTLVLRAERDTVVLPPQTDALLAALPTHSVCTRSPLPITPASPTRTSTSHESQRSSTPDSPEHLLGVHKR